MKFFKKSQLLLIMGLAMLSHAKAQPLTLTRDECIRIALEQSPVIKIADIEVKKSDYSRKETLASLFPQIDFSLNYQRSIELQTISMDMGGVSQKFKMGSDNSWNTGFSATLPLIAPTLWKAIGLSDTQILTTLESARASRLDMVTNVCKAYYGLQLAIASREVLRQQYDISVINAETYRKQFEQGTASEYDVLRSSVQVKNLEPELLQADIAVKQCQLQLLVLTGLEESVRIEPASSLEEMQASMKTIPTGKRNLDGNTSLRNLDLQTKSAQQNLTMKRFEYLPTLSMQFNLDWTALSNGSPFRHQEFNPYCNLGLSLSVPIFSGGKRYNAARQAKASLLQLSFQRQDLIDHLEMQTALAIDNINMQARQIESSLEGMKQARKAHDIMQRSFDIGAASYLELRDSELADTSARLAYLQAIHNYLTSMAELDNLLGIENF